MYVYYSSAIKIVQICLFRFVLCSHTPIRTHSAHKHSNTTCECRSQKGRQKHVLCVLFEIEFNSHTDESGQKFSYLTWAKYYVLYEEQEIIALRPVCLYYIYEYMCVTSEYCAVATRSSSWNLAIFTKHFIFILFYFTYLSLFADLIVHGQEGQ